MGFGGFFNGSIFVWLQNFQFIEFYMCEIQLDPTRGEIGIYDSVGPNLHPLFYSIQDRHVYRFFMIE